MRRLQNREKSLALFRNYKVRNLFNFLWPSQNIWTLKHTVYQLQAKMKVWFIGPSSEPNIIISTILHPSLCISNGNLNLMNYYQFTRCGKSRWEFRDFEMSNHWLCFDNLIRRERNMRSCYKLKPNLFEQVFFILFYIFLV